MTTICALVLILIGVAVGSLIRSVHAQTDVVPFQVGVLHAPARPFPCNPGRKSGPLRR